MQFEGLDALRRQGLPGPIKGPVALIHVEDATEVDSTLSHCREHGFGRIVVFAAPDIEVPTAQDIHLVICDTRAADSIVDTVNSAIACLPENTWAYYGFNAEYLFYPFSDSRTVGEMLAFHTEERRDAMLTYVVDLYAPDLGTAPNAVDRLEAHFDRSGYYALARKDADNHNHPRERQLDFFGGLRWRFEEHLPKGPQKIDRIALFKVKKGLRLRPDHTFNDEEYNTYACPWHHNLTAVVASFRAAKALKSNPGSRAAIDTFRWHGSARFDWNSRQLMDLGLMEPGQWF